MFRPEIPTRKPALGRDVLALVDPHVNGGSDVASAKIVRLGAGGTVNLRVFLDSFNPTVWRTGVRLFELEADARAAAGSGPVAWWPVIS